MIHQAQAQVLSQPLAWTVLDSLATATVSMQTGSSRHLKVALPRRTFENQGGQNTHRRMTGPGQRELVVIVCEPESVDVPEVRVSTEPRET